MNSAKRQISRTEDGKRVGVLGPWERGDLAIELAGESSFEPCINGSHAVLARLADRLGVALSTLIRDRNTASAWPPEWRPTGVTYLTCCCLRAQTDRFDLIESGTITSREEAVELVRQRRSARRC